ncbi:ribonuclease HII [candidate division WOR-3 bacterium]|uniref:Ribonuclease HII n=1 Tax=candidate division WOR-3 bacterium TaxID=2052148 RepID=A0A937XD47_UNCW3|nr:ribonuclease HII [candidate division WOR-3 bacterium]
MKYNLDQELWLSSSLFCGVDEVGRGALAGPVVAAAVILPRHATIAGVDDSKKLTPLRRERLEPEIKLRSVAWAVGAASHRFIEEQNIARASFRAMRLAVRRLRVQPELILADGWAIPDVGLPCHGIIHGDRSSLSIACASIIAKVWRDRLMIRLSRNYPGYGLDRHKGYGTAAHLRALRELGVSPIHRRTFKPVAALVASEQ